MAIRKIVARSIGVDVIVAEDLADNSITAAEITNGAVTADKLASNSVTTAKIAAGVTLTSPVMNTITSAAATALTLQSASTTAVTIDTSQNVGIGTASPVAKLNVKTLDAANAAMIAGTTIGARFSSDSSGIYIDGTDPTGSASYQPLFTGGSVFGVRISGTERMRIDSSGNLWFGTSTFSSSMQSGLSLQTASNSQLWVSHANGTGSGQYYAGFFYNGSVIGGVTQNGTTAVAYNTSSDYRLKDNIAPMTGALDKIALLKPVTYKWKIDGSDGQGFIAHELAEVVPDCVTGEKDAVDDEGKPKYQGIDTSFLVATLTAAIQELKVENDALKARLDAAGL